MQGIVEANSGTTVATYAGPVALVSQSHAICSSLVDWGLRNQIGFSAVLHIGSRPDTRWGEIIDSLGSDPKTRSIVIYMETVGDARAFLSAAREVALDKPILLIKGGRAEAGRRVAERHGGASPASDAVLDTALRRVGVLRVHELEDVFHITDALARQPRPAGPRLAIVTNAAGPAVLAADALAALGGQLASDLMDLGERAGADEYETAIDVASKDPNADGVLIIHSPQPGCEGVEIATRVTRFARLDGKPILATWMGSFNESSARSILNQAGIPGFSFPESAVRAFHYMWRYTYNLRGIYETPSLAEESHAAAGSAACLETVRQSGRTVLNETEWRDLLSAYGIPILEAKQPSMGYEFVLGLQVDPEFGPVLFFGAGGRLGSVLDTRVFALPPLNMTLARRFLEQSATFKVLEQLAQRDGFDVCALHAVMVRFSQLVLEQPLLSGLEINPLVIEANGLYAHAAHAQIHGLDVRVLPQPAIRPYPAKYASTVRLKDGTPLVIRPIRPEDEPALVRFHQTLSNESVYRRYFMPMSLEARTKHDRLTRMCFIDYDRQIAFVAEVPGEPGEIVGVGRNARCTTTNNAELAAVVSDAYQHRGIGRLLVERVIEFARDERLDALTAYVLAENFAMLSLLQKAGFRFSRHINPELMEGVLELPRS